MSSPISSTVGQVFVPVRDMRRAAPWYAELLGFTVDSTSLGHEDTIYDVPVENGPRLALDANHPHFVTSAPARFFFWTDDMAATLRHLDTMDAGDVSEVVDIGSLSFVTFTDPDGNLLMVAEPA